MKLQKLIYIGRHGYRAPIIIPKAYKKDWPGEGKLTLKGASSQYAKGISIRRSHLPFFQSITDFVDCITVNTSNLCRTKASAYWFLKGIRGLNFTPPKETDINHMMDELKNFGAKFRPLSKDVVFRSYCGTVSPSVKQIYKDNFKKLCEARKHEDVINEVLKKVGNLWEIDQSKPIDYFSAFYLFDFLSCYHDHDMELPQGFTLDMLKSLKVIQYYSLYDMTLALNTVRRLNNHYLFKHLIENLKSNKAPAFYYYSSHDSNVLSTLLALGYKTNEVPGYNEGLLIKVNDQQNVELEYKNRNINENIWNKKTVLVSELIELLEKERFKDDKEYSQYSGNIDFDYSRDYLNLKEDHDNTTERNLITLFTKAI